MKSLYFGPRHGCSAKIWPSDRFGLPMADLEQRFDEEKIFALLKQLKASIKNQLPIPRIVVQ
jgi:hypothetical protein